MNYTIHCECGAARHVTAQQAGSQITCSCGRSLDVPRLSKLRSSAGQEPIPIGIADRIQTMIDEGQLPESVTCPHSGLPADDTIYVVVQCERSWVRGSDDVNIGAIAAFFLAFGWLGALFASTKSRSPEQHGRNTVLMVPIRVARDARLDILKIRSQKKWRAYLREEPMYAELLDEFPDAEIAPVEGTKNRSIAR